MQEEAKTAEAQKPEETSEQNGSKATGSRRPINEALRNKLKDKRAVYLLPNMITLTSMFFGFLSMIWSVQGRFSDACLALLFSAIMDGLDGKVARLTHSASEFGVQFDSLADLVAFGIAPAVLMWQWQLQAYGRLGVTIAFIFAACGALRLARFNVCAATASKRFFIGLPIPAGASTVVCFVFFSSTFPAGLSFAIAPLAAIITLFTGLLMVSNVRYFSFKEYDVFKAHPYRVLIAFLIMMSLLYSAPKILSFIYCAAYIASGLIYTLVILPKKTSQLLRSQPASK